ncbi:hypothetical protein FB565_000216 [Actinoplanes lutulentus]|uniref:Uncharacterized protein n=1 Tax=Actinoplanes lutulentus TaxID=1287878 RepID=A0A327YWJ0_9ACTN|nr:hypothetical protein [Actinoplanes lutulentus]MBB2940512.1 hypothetical protein [Actinoplanes lutulentus]RAK25494.1 hypothetical protein B0I29_13333 [Actinoplanes lutulentus]
MRIITVTTADERAAVTAAAQAATIIRNRFNTAALIDVASNDSPVDGDAKYDLLNIWSAGESRDRTFHDPTWLWSVVADHGGHRLLPANEVRQVQTLLRTAGETNPYLFEPGELGANCWELDLDAVLNAHLADTRKQ